MKPNFIFVLLTGASLVCQAAADTILMKDGTRLEGKVLREDAETYTVEVLVTRSIKDEKVLKKADVATIEREKPDEKAFAEIKGYVPTPDMLTKEEYESRLNKARDFVKNHGSSPRAADAKKMVEELEKEFEAVSKGGIKLGGHMLDENERNANKFEVDARSIEMTIRSRAKSTQWAMALREFEKLEKEYQSSAAYREVLPFVRQIMVRYRTDAADASTAFPTLLARRQAGLERMKPEDRAISTRAIAEQDEAAKRRFEADKRAGVKWTTPDPDHKPSLDEAVKYADQELKRIDLIKPETLPDGGKAWREAWTAVHSGGDPKEASAAISAARSAKMPDRYIKELEAAAKDIK